MPGERRDRDPAEIPVRDAVERYLRRRRADATDASIKGWKYRLKLFIEWCEGIGIEQVGDLRGYDLDEYFEVRSGQDLSPSTLRGEMTTLRMFVRYLESIDAVEDGLSESVNVPRVSDEERSDDTRLDETVALPLLRNLREDPGWNGKRFHALLEVAWHVGARLGGLQALDLEDAHLEENYLHFRHRPETDTGLKNKSAGERPVAIPAEVSEVLERYIEHFRFDVRDDHGRQPLFASRRGRASKGLLRGLIYQATQPCLYRSCPHGKERETCSWTEYSQASRCPSSRSPHQIRTGSITWQLNIGIPPAIVAERVNATTQTIKQHYDKESPLKEMEARRRPFVDEMDLEETDQEDHDDS